MTSRLRFILGDRADKGAFNFLKKSSCDKNKVNDYGKLMINITNDFVCKCVK